MQNFSLTPGAQIAHYRFERRIGAGGMGEVFLATDLTLERQVALKILPPVLLSDNERVRRFVQEAKSASALNHPNIVTIYEIGQSLVTSPDGVASEEKVHYMAMEYIEGQTLREMIYGTSGLRDVLGVLAQAADGLAKAHGAGIVHRDLKPDNIMVTSDGYAKVVDFGLAKLTEKKQDPGGGQDQSITQSGMVMGTVGYMSPEQIDGSIIRPPSDVFAFGCILYEAVTKKKPFQSDLAIDTLHKIMFSEPAPLSLHVSDAPAAMQPIIDRCLKKSADDRYQNMRDVAVALREITGSGATARPESQLPPGYTAPPQSGGIVRPRIAVRPLDNIEDDEDRPRSNASRVAGLLFKLLLVGVAATLIYVGVTLPDLSEIADGKPAAITAGWSDYDDIAPSLRRAAVAALDPDFYERRPIKAKTLAVAAQSMTTPERRLYAPSPIAIAAAHALYGGSRANPAARVRTWAIAASMHSKLAGRRILELYLNTARYGSATGAADAAKQYFSKPPRKLSEQESALLSAAAITSGADPGQPTPELTAVRMSIQQRMKGRGEADTGSVKASSEPVKKAPASKSRKRKKGPAAAPVTTTTAADTPAPPEPVPATDSTTTSP